MSLGDLFRFVIAAEGSVIGAMMLVINYQYYRVWQGVRKTGDSFAGLLPKHIATVSLSYAILAYGLVAGNLANLGQPFNWRLILYVIGLGLGVVALYIMGKRQGKRISIERTPMSISMHESSTLSQRD